MIKYIKYHILLTISVISFILLLIPVAIFLYHFGGNKISTDVNVWASFGDYIGGTVNTILSLSSLIILAILTHNIGKQSNEENKKANLLIKRLDSYEKITDYMPKINQIMAEINIDLDDINNSYEKKNYEVNNLLKELENKTKFFIELHAFIQTFGIRYGHLYNYNFGSEEFVSLSQDIAPTLNYFSQILMKLKKRQSGFPPYPKESFTSFLNTFGKVIFHLSTELK